MFISTNSVRGARFLSTSKLCLEPNRLKHTLRVVQNSYDLAEELNLNNKSKDLLIKAAYLHDIGYSSDLNLTGFHPYDGFAYLTKLGWDMPTRLLVLNHTEARKLEKPDLYEVKKAYDYSLPVRLNRIYKLLTIADMTAGSNGERVTFEERLQDIRNRYGETHPITVHAEDTIDLCKKWVIELKG